MTYRMRSDRSAPVPQRSMEDTWMRAYFLEYKANLAETPPNKKQS